MRCIQAARNSFVLRAIGLSLPVLFLLFAVQPVFAAGAPGLSIVSGNGQVAIQYFNTTVPLTVEARDANGNLVPNLPISWAVTQGQGTIVSPPSLTDASGRASAFYRGDVTPGYTFSQQTIQVSSSVGSVNFVITTNVSRLPNGSIAELPVAELQSPALDDPPLSARSGGSVPNAIRVAVTAQSGIQSGQPVPNVSFKIVDPNDLSATPVAQCAGQPMTDAQGQGRCDLVVTGAPGTYGVAVEIGEYRISRIFLLQVRSAAQCGFTVLASSTQFGPVAGIGTLNITAPSGCDWTAVSNASWLTITSGQNGNGSGGATFSVTPNTGPTRTATITVAGQVLNITQAGTGGGASGLQISTPATLPSAAVGTAYTATLTVTGGRAPYSWIAASALPAGLTLNPGTGVITGTPSTAGTFTTSITVTDQAGSALNQTFSLTVVPQGGTQPPPSSGGNPSFASTNLPSAPTGITFTFVLTTTGGCETPFTAPSVISLAGGSLPAGISIQKINDRTYVITGTPTTPGTSNFTLTVTDPCGKVGTANFTMTVIAGSGNPGGGQGSGAVSANPTALSFSLPSGAAGNVHQLPLAVSGPSDAIFFAATSVSTGGSWLQIIGDASGSFPATLAVRAAGTGALANGNYTGTVLINSPAGNLSVPVTLTVGSGPGGGTGNAALSVAPSAINLTAQIGSGAQPQSITITNATGSARFSVQTSTLTGGAWLSVDRTSGDAPGSLVATLNPAGLAAGTYTGSIVITPVSPTGSTQTIPVTLQVTAPAALAASPGALSFATQAGNPIPVPQNITVQSTGAAFGATISSTTQTGGNWLLVTPNQGTTPVTITVSANPAGLAPGSYQGSVMITPTVPGITPMAIPITLTIPQNGPQIAAISNAASFLPGPVAPGEIVTLFGSAMGPATLATSRLTLGGRLDSLLEETRVYFDEIAAPLVYTSATQLSAIVPYGIEGRFTTKVTVEYRGVRSTPVELGVVGSSPAFFTLSPNGQAAALNQDGSINGPQRGAAPGSIIVLFATGEGPTDPTGQDGKLATDAVLPKPKQAVTVRINGQIATVLYAGAAPNLSAGVMQINAVIPSNVASGTSVPVTLQVGQAISPGTVTIAIR